MKAITEMVPHLIWAPDFFGPQEIWSLRNLVPKKFGSLIKMPYNDFYAGPKFLRDQISRGLTSWDPKKSGAQMRSGTISVIAQMNTLEAAASFENTLNWNSPPKKRETILRI